MTAAFALWLGYGLLIGSWPVVAFNVCNLVLGAAIAALSYGLYAAATRLCRVPARM